MRYIPCIPHTPHVLHRIRVTFINITLSMQHHPVVLRVFRADGTETYHNDMQRNKMLEWIEGSAASRVVELFLSDFPDRIINSEDIWIVDFYASWCPPCKAMLPAFRIASERQPNVHFGSVDCNVEQQLCRNVNLHAYPSIFLYGKPGSTPQQFGGNIMDAGAFLHFIDMTLNPATEQLTLASFTQNVVQDTSSIWVSFRQFPPFIFLSLSLSPTLSFPLSLFLSSLSPFPFLIILTLSLPSGAGLHGAVVPAMHAIQARV